MTGPAWSASDVDAAPVAEHHPHLGVRVRVGRVAAVLGPELARSLAWWLLWRVGDRPAPGDPDAVRVAVDDARAALAARSADPGTTEDYRAGLAWCDHHLDAVSRAASSNEGSST